MTSIPTYWSQCCFFALCLCEEYGILLRSIKSATQDSKSIIIMELFVVTKRKTTERYKAFGCFDSEGDAIEAVGKDAGGDLDWNQLPDNSWFGWMGEDAYRIHPTLVPFD